MEGRSISKASSVTEIGCGKNSRGRYKPYSSVALRSPKSHPQRVDGQLILRRARQRCRRCSTRCLDDRRRTADRSGKRERVFLKVSVWDGQKLLAFFRIKFVQLIVQSSTKKIESQYGSSTYEQPSIRSCSISWGIEKKKKGRWRFQTVAPTDQRWTLKAAEPAMTTMFQSWDEKSERIKRPGRSSLGGHREICESLAIICELPDRKISQILANYRKLSQIIACTSCDVRYPRHWRDIDGQNVNQKLEMLNLYVLILSLLTLANFSVSFFFFSDQATLSSILQVNVWHRPQGTKKSKKRNLVASGTHRLGKLLKEQEHELSTRLILYQFLSNGS